MASVPSINKMHGTPAPIEIHAVLHLAPKSECTKCNFYSKVTFCCHL